MVPLEPPPPPPPPQHSTRTEVVPAGAVQVVDDVYVVVDMKALFFYDTTNVRFEYFNFTREGPIKLGCQQ
ncbi:TPA: hypothetical protein DIU27_04555 [Candidatus Collierbacteria bacterium]|nr:hypothetical protein [Candidatus Collierbacteria bacterium]